MTATSVTLVGIGDDGKGEAMAESTQERPVIDAKDAARQLKVSVSMVYKLLRLGQLEGYAVGRRRIIYADSIEDFRRRSAIGPASAPEPVPAEQTPPRHRQRKEKVKTAAQPIRLHLR